MDAVALAESEVAVIVAEPSATEVTRPEEETVATAAADVAHVAAALLIAPPFWSLTVTTSVAVSPSAPKFRLAGEIVIEVAIGVGGPVGVSSDPHPATIRARARSRALFMVRHSIIKFFLANAFSGIGNLDSYHLRESEVCFH